MAILTTSSGPTNAIRTLYSATYVKGAEWKRLYDMFAAPISKYGVETAARLGSTVRVNFLMDLPIGTNTISQTADMTPQTMVDAYAEISPTSRGEAVQWAEILDMEAYTNLVEERYAAVGRQAGESIDVLAQDAALQGSLVLRYAARASLSAATSAHFWNEKEVVAASELLNQVRCPAYVDNGRPQWFALGNTAILKDLRESGNIVEVAKYQDKEIIFGMEIASLGPFKLLLDPRAKIFIGQGAAPTSSYSTTLAAATTAGQKTYVTSSTTNSTYNKWHNIIDAAETGDTHYYNNERVWFVSSSGSSFTIVGGGKNGGFRFSHASGVTVTNNYSVYPVVYGGPASMAKLYDAQTGEFGDIVGPKLSGLANQFQSLAWKFYGGYGRWAESWLVRGEYSASFDVRGS